MRVLAGVIAAVGVLGAVYLLFSGYLASRSQRAGAIVPGWDKLSDCSPVTSFDGTKTLYFLENQVVTVRRQSESTSSTPEHEISGHWSYDDVRHRYTVSLDEEPRQYALINPNRSDVCILAVGDLTALNLYESWFGTIPSDPTYDYEPPPYDR